MNTTECLNKSWIGGTTLAEGLGWHGFDIDVHREQIFLSPEVPQKLVRAVSDETLRKEKKRSRDAVVGLHWLRSLVSRGLCSCPGGEDAGSGRREHQTLPQKALSRAI
jgi:hypothetical protein